MRALARWGALPLLTAPLGTWALGLGEIELQSALNQPFQAEIALVSVTPDEAQGLEVTLANQATFDRYGLDRPSFLTALSFRVGRDNAGRDVILVSSRESIAEPFVTMLVEATWPRGRLLREYTVLLDPPVLLPEPAAPVPVQPAQTRTPEPNVPGGAITRPEPAPRAQPVQPPVQREQPVSRVTPPPPAQPDGSGVYGPVQRGDTLWGVATQYRPNGVTMNQMMVSLYEANPQAFDNNMNLLQVGATLRIPEFVDLANMPTGTATAEVQRQTEAWQGGSQQARLRLVPPSSDPAILGGSSDSAQSNTEFDALRDQLGSLESELDESERLLELRDQQLADLQNQLDAANQAAAVVEAEAEAQLPPPLAADPGVELESEQLFADEPEPEPEPLEAAPTVVQPVPSPTQVVTTASDQPSLLSQAQDLLTSTTVLIGVGIGALLLAALLFMRRRGEDAEDVTGRWDALEAEVDIEEDVDHEATARLRARSAEDKDIVVVEQPADLPDEPDFAATEAGTGFEFESTVAEPPAEAAEEGSLSEDTLSSQTVINLDQADPVAEADFHMAYGLYDQAADLVSNALQASPDSRALKLKLLEVFFVWGNKEAFLDRAESLRLEMGEQTDGDWDKVIIMGKQICPDESLFAEATVGAGQVDVDLEAGDAPALDMAFDGSETAGVDLDLGDADVDLDLGALGESDIDLQLEASGEHAGAADVDVLDLEATGNREEEESLLDLGLGAEDPLDASLDIGAATSAGLEAAFLDDSDSDTDTDADTGTEPGTVSEPSDDTGRRTAPNLDIDIDSLAATQESPTIETPSAALGEDWAEDTLESPTVEAAGPESDTVETEFVDGEEERPVVDTPTVQTEVGGPIDISTAEHAGIDGTVEMTEELDLDALGLDVSDLEDLPSDLGEPPSVAEAESDTREQPALDSEDDLLSATGVTQVLRDEPVDLEHDSTAVLSDDAATMLAPGLDYTMPGTDIHTGTEVMEQAPDDLGMVDSPSDETASATGIDLNLDDLSAALEGADTIEQPRAFEGEVFGGGTETPVDLDVGSDVAADNAPTGTEEVTPLDPQTMTEVGTKLDLARAYIDMGDPEGARSILEEVLGEGDTGQRDEAQTLMDVLTA